ncbi:hypothetical protein UB44_23305 [Burkholderiaceae bacterium 26]|nr:hypothetical protein UB44_23305 [Burkholderiaceae bacterium 26]
MANAGTFNAQEFSLDQLDELVKRSSQLVALLATLRGVGYQSFKVYSEEIQENTLWLAGDLAEQIHDGLLLSSEGGKS